MMKLGFLIFRLLFFALLGSTAFASTLAGAAPSFQPLENLSPLQSKTSVIVRANIHYGDQDEQAVPVEANFYLLDQSVVRILKSIPLQPIFPDGKKHRSGDADYLEAAAKILTARQDDDEAAIVAVLINDALLKHQSMMLRTNDSGRGFARSVKPGQYYLFGIGRIDEQIIVWHRELTVKAGINAVEIDQSDAELIFAADE